MFCTYCGGELREGSEFCTKCGQKISPGYIPQPAASAVPGGENRSAGAGFAEPSFQIRCAHCNEIIGDEAHPVHNCPYCGRVQGLNIAVDPGSPGSYTGQTVMPGNYGGAGYSGVNDSGVNDRHGHGSGAGRKTREPYGGVGRRMAIATACFAIAVVCFIIAGITGLVKDEFVHEEIIWPQSGLSQMIPGMNGPGEIYRDGSDTFSAEIYNVSKSDYAAYVEQCKSNGFDVDAVKDSDSFYAYNVEGYKLSLDYYDYEDELNIRLTAPIEMRKITLADKGLGGLLPALPSDMGYIDTETESFMNLYLGGVTKEQYDELVTACIQSGFDEEYSRIGDYFCGENSDGVSLTVQYIGNNTIQITMGR